VSCRGGAVKGGGGARKYIQYVYNMGSTRRARTAVAVAVAAAAIESFSFCG